MLSLLVYLVVGFGAIGAFLFAAFLLTLNKMVTDEMRARLDDIPAVLVALALRLVPAEQRDFLEADWVDNLLVAFDEKNARYPASRIIRSLPFVLPLFGTATGLRRQGRAIRKRGAQGEKLERLQAPRAYSDLDPFELGRETLSRLLDADVVRIDTANPNEVRSRFRQSKEHVVPISVRELLRRNGDNR